MKGNIDYIIKSMRNGGKNGESHGNAEHCLIFPKEWRNHAMEHSRTCKAVQSCVSPHKGCVKAVSRLCKAMSRLCKAVLARPVLNPLMK